MTAAEKIAVFSRKILYPMLFGLGLAVWGALVYTGGPAESPISGRWQTTLADRGWQITALFMLNAVGGMIAPFFAMWYFHKSLTRIGAIRKSGLAAWLRREEEAQLTDIRRRSAERIGVDRDR